jgi:hypothetical protein
MASIGETKGTARLVARSKLPREVRFPESRRRHQAQGNATRRHGCSTLRAHLLYLATNVEPPGWEKSTSERFDMRLILAALCISAYASIASAQTQPDLNRLSGSQPINDDAKSSDDKGQAQPQGASGPLTTGSGGTTAASPQGGTPPNMQATPDGSSKTSVDKK